MTNVNNNTSKITNQENRMEKGKFNVLLDQAFGSSGKGKMSTWLAEHFDVMRVSSSNYPNAGHSVVFEDGFKFVAKAIPTAAALKQARHQDIECWISPGSGFDPERLVTEWIMAGKPRMFIHSRANLVTDVHKKRESEGKESTVHLASTMQGSAAAMVDKILRKSDCLLARTIPTREWTKNPQLFGLSGGKNLPIMEEFAEKVKVLPSHKFRSSVQSLIAKGDTWFHEGSQGFALSIDHGYEYPFCTSRNCSMQAAMDHMAIPPSMVGDVYLNIRPYPIRVGNVVKDGVQLGHSGNFYPDSEEITWEQVAQESGMPPEEVEKLKAREYTTVTGRLRRVSSFSWIGLKDAVQTNGATKLIVNFIQYVNWEDRGLKGGKEVFEKLSKKSREFIDKIQEKTNVPVVLIGTGALHGEIISLI
jgi:adenylosuccinate synthase